MKNVPPLLLASTSRYRSELLTRLGVPFQCVRPETDESPLADEHPGDLAQRLAQAKAAAVLSRQSRAWVIGSDQVAELDGGTIGKPGSPEGAIAQLHAMSGRTVSFHTAVCLLSASDSLHAIDTTRVVFRDLSVVEIKRYVDAERPFDCAGSFKVEGLGISLFESVDSSDPTALIGLPLIATARLLREAGFQIP